MKRCIIVMAFDEPLFRAINALAGQLAAMDWIMVQLAKPGNLLYPGFLVGGYWLWKNRRECLIASAVLAAVITGTDAIGTQVKNLVQRPRPCLSLQGVSELLGCGGAFSFPSNHAVNTAAAAAFFQVLYPQSGWISWPLVAAIGFSRVYIGAHYVTDVVGGWVLGGSIGGVVAWMLHQRLLHHPKHSRKPVVTSSES